MALGSAPRVPEEVLALPSAHGRLPRVGDQGIYTESRSRSSRFTGGLVLFYGAGLAAGAGVVSQGRVGVGPWLPRGDKDGSGHARCQTYVGDGARRRDHDPGGVSGIGK